VNKYLDHLRRKMCHNKREQSQAAGNRLYKVEFAESLPQFVRFQPVFGPKMRWSAIDRVAGGTVSDCHRRWKQRHTALKV
jgi:hypothetical protein